MNSMCRYIAYLVLAALYGAGLGNDAAETRSLNQYIVLCAILIEVLAVGDKLKK